MRFEQDGHNVNLKGYQIEIGDQHQIPASQVVLQDIEHEGEEILQIISMADSNSNKSITEIPTNEGAGENCGDQWSRYWVTVTGLSSN